MSRSSAGAGLCSIIRCGGIHCAVARLPTPAAIRSRLRISTSSDPLDAVMTLRRRTASPRLQRRRHARTPLEAACIAPKRISVNGSAGAPLFILRRQAVPAAFYCAYSFPEVADMLPCALAFRSGLHCARTHRRQRFSRRTLVHSEAADRASHILLRAQLPHRMRRPHGACRACQNRCHVL